VIDSNPKPEPDPGEAFLCALTHARGFLPKIATTSCRRWSLRSGALKIAQSLRVVGIQPKEMAGILPAEDAGRTSAGVVVPTACKYVRVVSRLAVGFSWNINRSFATNRYSKSSNRHLPSVATSLNSSDTPATTISCSAQLISLRPC